MENGSNGSNGNDQLRTEDVMLMQALLVHAGCADPALLHALRSYVQEVVRCEVVQSLSTGGELMQNMIKFQVAKQMRDSGILEQVKEYVLEQLEEGIIEAASAAGFDGGRSVLEDECFVSEQGARDIAEQAAKEQFEEFDYDEVAEEVVRHRLDTEEVVADAARQVVEQVEDDMLPRVVREEMARLMSRGLGYGVHCGTCGEIMLPTEMEKKRGNKWTCKRCIAAPAAIPR